MNHWTKLGERNVPILEPLIQSLINLNKRLIELGFSCQNNILRSKKSRKKESRDQKIHITFRAIRSPDLFYQDLGQISFKICRIARVI